MGGAGRRQFHYVPRFMYCEIHEIGSTFINKIFLKKKFLNTAVFTKYILREGMHTHDFPCLQITTRQFMIDRR